MIVNAKRKELLLQAKKVARAAAPSHNLKELAGILLETDGRTGVVRLTATNLEVAIRSEMPAAIEKDGNAVIDARLFSGILDKLPGEDVYMELLENGQLYFRSSKSQFSVAVLNRKNYPAVEIPHPGSTVTINGLRSLISRSVFATATRDPARPVMSCVNLIFSENGVRAIGCDGYCVAEATGDPDGKGSISLLVPASSMKLIASIADDSDVFEVGVTGNEGSIKNVVFSDGTTLISARLIDGKYLDTDDIFKRLVPEAIVKTDAKALKNALESIISLVSNGDRVEFSFGDNGLILRCESEAGAVNFTMDADISLATNEVYYFIPKNLLNCAKVLSGNVTLNFSKDKILEICADNTRFLQIGARPMTKAQKTDTPEKKPRGKAAA